jgi:hypothetical protein
MLPRRPKKRLCTPRFIDAINPQRRTAPDLLSCFGFGLQGAAFEALPRGSAPRRTLGSKASSGYIVSISGYRADCTVWSS